MKFAFNELTKVYDRFRSFPIRMASLFAGFGFALLVVSTFGTSLAGRYFFFVSTTLFFSAYARAGMDGHVLKSCASADDVELGRLISLANRVTGKRIIFGLPVYLCVVFAYAGIQGDALYVILMGLVNIIACYFVARLNLNCNALLGRQQDREAALCLTLAAPLVGITMCAVVKLGDSPWFGRALMAVLYLVVNAAACAVSVHFLSKSLGVTNRQLPRAAPSREAEAELLRAARPLLIPSLVSLIPGFYPQAVLGFTAVPSDVSIFNICIRAANAITTVGQAGSARFQGRLAVALRGYSPLKKISAELTVLSGQTFALVVLLGLVIYLSMPSVLLVAHIGPFRERHLKELLAVLLIAQLPGAVLAWAPQSNIITGQYETYRQISIISGIGFVFCVLVGAFAWGAEGVAYALLGVGLASNGFQAHSFRAYIRRQQMVTIENVT